MYDVSRHADSFSRARLVSPVGSAGRFSQRDAWDNRRDRPRKHGGKLGIRPDGARVEVKDTEYYIMVPTDATLWKTKPCTAQLVR